MDAKLGRFRTNKNIFISKTVYYSQLMLNLHKIRTSQVDFMMEVDAWRGVCSLYVNLYNKGDCVCVCVCLFSIEIQTAGRIGTKFGTQVVLEGGKDLGGVSTRYPHPPGYGVCKGGVGCLWSLSHAFWQKLYKTKVAGTPKVVEAGQLFGLQILIMKALGPMSFMSCGCSNWNGFGKAKVVMHVPNN